MSRRGSAKPTGIQMFPFLAVLICTMGALVVLLHAFARHGKNEAMKTAQAKAREVKAEDAMDADYFRWRSGHLRESRDKTLAQLQAERLKLSHVEDHERRLRQKLDELKLAAAELERAGEATSGKEQVIADELADTLAQVEEARLAVAAARRDGKTPEVNYSVVPYFGPNATDRRPIYIECCADGIVLQPEAVRLTRRDFIGLMGPGNPLASALRAEREYFARQAPTGRLPGEPYPLLLVRPDGVHAYLTARVALDSWSSDFGYELVGADWTLDFPRRDERLAQLLEQVVAEARGRQREFVRITELAGRQRSRAVYHVNSRGGVSKVAGGGNDPSGLGGWDDDENWADSSGGASRGGRYRAGSQVGGSRGSQTLADSPGGGPGGSHESGGFGDDSRGDGFGDGSDEFAGGGDGELVDPYAEPDAIAPLRKGGPYSEGSGPGQGGEPSSPAEGPAMGSLDGRPGSAGGYRSQDEAFGGDAQGPGGPRQEQSAAGGGGPAQGSRGHRASNEPQAPSQSAGGSGSPATDNESTQQVGSSSSSPMHLSSPNSPHVPHGSPKKPRSMASSRGEDWGLPGESRDAIAASRPILVQCYADRLVVMPESRNQAPRQVRLGNNSEAGMDELVSTVWDTMQVWGKAGRGMYWRPTLTMDVQPGGQARFEEVKALLANSGLDVEQRRPPARPAERLPARR